MGVPTASCEVGGVPHNITCEAGHDAGASCGVFARSRAVHGVLCERTLVYEARARTRLCQERGWAFWPRVVSASVLHRVDPETRGSCVSAWFSPVSVRDKIRALLGWNYCIGGVDIGRSSKSV